MISQNDWNFYDKVLSQVDSSIMIYIESINKISKALEYRKERGLINHSHMHQMKEIMNKNLLNLIEIQKIQMKKSRYVQNYFPIIFEDQHLNLNLLGDLDDLIQDVSANYISYHSKKIPIYYESVNKKGGEPNKPWLAPHVYSKRKDK